ncbi:thioesterase family protein [Myxococcota bacterium]|nr:thioesterase family protein [Myxococcota bacterium]
MTELLACLELEPTGEDRFQAPSEPSPHGLIYGGALLAQALRAAGSTVASNRPAHAIHALLLERGRTDQGVVLEVDRLRDGRSFSARRVVISQNERPLLTLQASFHVLEEGFEHQPPMPQAPAPDSLPTLAEMVEKASENFPDRSAQWAGSPRPLDFRQTVVPAFMGGDSREASNLAWFRFPSKLPDDPILHQCLLVYASDMSLNDNCYKPHSGPDQPDVRSVSTIDHTMWFHAPARADEWTLFTQHSPRAGAGRGYASGTMYTHDGRMVVTLAQDSLMRPEPR